MRSLEINKQTIWYSLYLGKVTVKDEEGNDTGETELKYTDPVSVKIRVSPNKGESNVQQFGLSLDYDRTMVTTDKLPIDEHSILWVDSAPELETDGTLKLKPDGTPVTPHEYIVKRVAPDNNVTQYAIKKVV